MHINIPFLNKPKVDITSVVITMSKKTHSLPGLKVHKDFIYKLSFSNTESKPIRVLSISIAEPFRLVKLNYNLPLEIPSGKKVIFHLKSSLTTEYVYSGPMKISIESLILN